MVSLLPFNSLLRSTSALKQVGLALCDAVDCGFRQEMFHEVLERGQLRSNDKGNLSRPPGVLNESLDPLPGIVE